MGAYARLPMLLRIHHALTFANSQYHQMYQLNSAAHSYECFITGEGDPLLAHHFDKDFRAFYLPDDEGNYIRLIGAGFLGN